MKLFTLALLVASAGARTLQEATTTEVVEAIGDEIKEYFNSSNLKEFVNNSDFTMDWFVRVSKENETIKSSTSFLSVGRDVDEQIPFQAAFEMLDYALENSRPSLIDYVLDNATPSLVAIVDEMDYGSSSSSSTSSSSK